MALSWDLEDPGKLMEKHIHKRWRVNIYEPYDVCIMRPGPWGNPYSSKAHASSTFKVNSRNQAIKYFQTWVLKQPDYIKKAKLELTGKILACGCQEHELCHGDVLVAVIYDLPLPLQDKVEESFPTLF